MSLTHFAPVGVRGYCLSNPSAMRAYIVHAESQGALPVAVGTGHARAAWVQWVAGHRDRHVAAAVYLGQGEILPGRQHGVIMGLFAQSPKKVYFTACVSFNLLIHMLL